MSKDTEYSFSGKILSVESIFKWKPVIYEENLNEISCELEPYSKNEFNFNNFIILLIKSYRAGETGDIDSALELLNQLDDTGKEYNDEANGGFFERIQNAYYHMVYASKIFLLIKKNKHQEASMIIDKIISIDDMDKSNKAAIYAMKAAIFALYSNEDTQKALASIDKALILDPNNPHWNFLKGFCKRRIRKMTNPFDVPTLQEQNFFKNAYHLNDRNVVYKLYLADVYREISPHAFKRQKDCCHFLPADSSLTENLRNDIDEKIKLAVEYYKQAAEDYSDSPYVMFKCAEGLVRLYPKENFIQLARKLTEDGLKKNPENINGHLVMAFICEYIDKNFEEAEKHMKKCQAKKIFDADLNMIRFLHFTKPKKFDGVEALEILLQKYQEKKRHAILYSQLVSYYVFVNLDLVKACDAAMKYFALNCESTCMQIHKSLFVNSKDPFSLLDVLNDEVKLAMTNAKTAKNVKNKCAEYSYSINFQNYKIIKGTYKNFRKQILQGNAMFIDPKYSQPPKKFNNFNKGGKICNTYLSRGDFNGKKNQLPNNNSNTSVRPNTDDRRSNNKQLRIPPTGSSELPSLMKCIVDKPPEPSEKRTKPRSEDDNGDPEDTEDKELVKLISQIIKKQKENKPRKSRDLSDDSEESIVSTLQRLVFGKKTRGKKYCSYSDSDSDHKRRINRRRERSRRRRRSESYSSDESDRHDRHYRRRCKRNSSTDSDDNFRSSRYPKSHHKKDHRQRGCSPGKRRTRRDNSISPGRRDSGSRSPSYDRYNQRRYPKKEKSIRRSPSYDRRNRQYSPRKEKWSHENDKNLPDRYSSRDQKLDEIDQQKKAYKSKSSRWYNHDTASYEEKSRYASKEKSGNHRDMKEL